MKMTLSGSTMEQAMKAALAVRDEGVMELKEDRWILKTMDPGDVLLIAMRVNQSSMEFYDKRETDEIGFAFENVKQAIQSKNEPVTIEKYQTSGGVNKLKVKHLDYEAGIPLVASEYVEGRTDSVPTLPWVATATGDLSFIQDFASRADSLVDSTWMIIGAREDGIHLYSKEDDTDLHQVKSWDHFDKHTLDWSNGVTPEGHEYKPSEDEKADTILSIDYVKSMKMVSDEGTLHVNEAAPVKVLLDAGDGVDFSYFVSPRTSQGSEDARIPE